MAKFPSELSDRGTVKTTDKLIIHNIDTGATEYTTVADLLATFAIAVLNGNIGISTETPTLKVDIYATPVAPAASGIIPNGHFALTSSAGTNIYMGQMPASPYGAWMQAQDGGALGTNYPLLLNPNGGNIGIGTAAPTSKLHVVGLPEYNDNTNAAASGLTVGAFYRTADALKIVHA